MTSFLRWARPDASFYDVRIAIQRSHTLLSDNAQLFDAPDARSNYAPIMQSVRDLNNSGDGWAFRPFDKCAGGLFKSRQ